MDKIIVENYRTKIDGDYGYLYVTIDGKEEFVCCIGNIKGFSGAQIQEYSMSFLDINGFALANQTPAPKPKRKYTKRVNLGLASDFGKVTLKLAEQEKIAFFKLKLKANNEYVIKLDERGIYTSNAKTSRPLRFTKNDINRIRNIDDFIVEKDFSTKTTRDKIA